MHRADHFQVDWDRTARGNAQAGAGCRLQFTVMLRERTLLLGSNV